MKTKTKKKISVTLNPEFRDAIGKSSLLQIEWKPLSELIVKKQHLSIFIILKNEDGYHPFPAEYIYDISEVTIKTGNNFSNILLHELGKRYYIADPDDMKKIVAWGYLSRVKKLTERCIICKEIQCQC
jgi:hypothetical protein